MPLLTLLFNNYPQVEDLKDLAAQAAQEEEEDQVHQEKDHLQDPQPSWCQSPWLPILNILEWDQPSLKEIDNWQTPSSENLEATFKSIKEYPDLTHPLEKWLLLSLTSRDLESFFFFFFF